LENVYVLDGAILVSAEDITLFSFAELRRFLRSFFNMLNEQEPWPSVANEFALNGMESDSELFRVVKLDNLRF
jgi:hypothetical protein